MSRIRRVTIVLSLVALVGCASAPAPVTYYLLRGDPVERVGRVDAEIRAGLGRIVVASYLLSTQGVMLETGPGEVNPASQYQWAEPLDSGLRWFLQSEIGAELGLGIGGGLTERQSWDYTVDVLVTRLHGTMSGRALIEASFAVRPTDESQETSEFRFAKSIPLAREGYGGLVEAEESLLRELAVLIADALRERMHH